jgi:hypothetical protein
MVDIFYVLTILQDTVLALILFLTVLYSFTLIFIRRFHHHSNIFLLNVCLTIITTAIFFTIHFTMTRFAIQILYRVNTCIILIFAYNISSIAIPFAFVTFSVHRLCFIVYHTKPFFKTKKWIAICIASQWIGEVLISLPFLLRSGPVSIYYFIQVNRCKNKSFI